MSYQIEWLAEPRLLFVGVAGKLNISEVAEANDMMMEFLNNATAPLYVIADVSALTDYPRIASDLQKVLRSFYHPMLGASYLYGVSSPAVNVILRILTRISSFDYYIVKSFDDALAAMEQKEPDLAPYIATVDRSAWR